MSLGKVQMKLSEVLQLVLTALHQGRIELAATILEEDLLPAVLNAEKAGQL